MASWDDGQHWDSGLLWDSASPLPPSPVAAAEDREVIS